MGTALRAFAHPTTTAVFVSLGIYFAAAPAAADTTPEQYQSIVENTIADYIRPEFENLKTQTAKIATAMDGLCKAPTSGRLADATRAFNEVLNAWSRVEYVRLGPVIEDKRLERFSFWPDPKGIGLRQVQKIIGSKDESATSVETLKEKSVAVQGLQALEFVLFGSGSETLATNDGFRCAYGKAVTDNLDAIAEEIRTGWADEEGYVALMRNPGPDNPVYRTPAEPAGDIVEVFSTGFQFIRDVKLGAFVGENPEAAKPRRAAFRRSGQALNAVHANFAGLKRLWEASGLVAVLETRPSGPGTIGSVNFEFDTALRDLEEGFPPLEQAVDDARQHNRIRYLLIVANTQWRFFAEDISAALGLRMGFNALDGD